MTNTKKHVISVIVDNEFGALARIVELFSARACNIESLNVSPINQEKTISRVTIVSYSSTKVIDLICKLLNRLIPVHKAVELTREDGYIERELALVKIIGNEAKKKRAMEIVDIYRTNIIDITEDSVVFEILGTSTNIDDVMDKLGEIGIDGLSRTGIAAGFRGNKTIKDLNYV